MHSNSVKRVRSSCHVTHLAHHVLPGHNVDAVEEGAAFHLVKEDVFVGDERERCDAVLRRVRTTGRRAGEGAGPAGGSGGHG